MSTDEGWFPSHLTEITKSECVELLANHHVGRVAYCDESGPVVLPVNYVMDQDTVLVQLSPHSTLAKNLLSGAASFEVDDFDDFVQSGWSVLVRGNAGYVDNADLPEAARGRFAWAEGQRTFHVRITPREITGRRLVAA